LILNQSKPGLIANLSLSYDARRPKGSCYLEELAVSDGCFAADKGSYSAACAIFRVRFETGTDDRETSSLSKTHFVPGIRGSRETRTA
jgi:hypothetical protein